MIHLSTWTGIANFGRKSSDGIRPRHTKHERKQVACVYRASVDHHVLSNMTSRCRRMSWESSNMFSLKGLPGRRWGKEVKCNEGNYFISTVCLLRLVRHDWTSCVSFMIHVCFSPFWWIVTNTVSRQRVIDKKDRSWLKQMINCLKITWERRHVSRVIRGL